MALSARRQRIIAEACPGCRYNRYNKGKGFQETKHDAVVTCDCCWHVDSMPKYDRKAKRFKCPMNER